MKELNTEHIHVLPNGNVYVKIHRDGILCEQVLVGFLSSYGEGCYIFKNEDGQYILRGDMENIVTELELLFIYYFELPW